MHAFETFCPKPAKLAKNFSVLNFVFSARMPRTVNLNFFNGVASTNFRPVECMGFFKLK